MNNQRRIVATLNWFTNGRNNRTLSGSNCIIHIITRGLTGSGTSWQVIRYYQGSCSRALCTYKKHWDEPGTRARVIPMIQMMIIDADAVCGVMVRWPFSGAAISTYRSTDMNDRINTETLTGWFYFNILTMIRSISIRNGSPDMFGNLMVVTWDSVLNRVRNS